MKKILTFGILILFSAHPLWASYEPQLARDYALQWWNTDEETIGSDFGKVDHVNYPRYTWIRNDFEKYSGIKNTMLVSEGVNCSNYVSQCLLSGGVDLTPIFGPRL